MDLLARREHSLAELREKLTAREFEPGGDRRRPSPASPAKASPTTPGSWRPSSPPVSAGGRDPLESAPNSLERGIDAEAIAAGLADAHDWRALAREVRVKRFGAAPPQDFRERARQSRFLEYRGFAADQIRGCFGDDDE